MRNRRNNYRLSQRNPQHSLDLRMQLVIPSPLYSGLHRQLNDPLVLIHSALVWQLSMSSWHSSISILQVYSVTVQ